MKDVIIIGLFFYSIFLTHAYFYMRRIDNTLINKLRKESEINFRLIRERDDFSSILQDVISGKIKTKSDLDRVLEKHEVKHVDILVSDDEIKDSLKNS